MFSRFYSYRLLQRISRVLKKGDLRKFQIDRKRKIVSFGINHQDTDFFNCFYVISEGAKSCILYIKQRENIDESSRLKISEFLTYANYGLHHGNFELDISDGEVRYKVCFFIKERAGSIFYRMPSKRALESALDVGIATFLRYKSGIDDLCKNPNTTPEEACLKIEKPNQKSSSLSNITREDVKKIVEAIQAQSSTQTNVDVDMLLQSLRELDGTQTSPVTGSNEESLSADASSVD